MTEQQHIDRERGTRGLSPGAEIAMLISAAVSPKPHPASAILKALDTRVEAQSRDIARHEIAEIAKQVARQVTGQVTGEGEARPEHKFAPARVISVNPFAPVPAPSRPATWLSDAITAQEAKAASATWNRMANFTAGPATEPAGPPMLPVWEEAPAIAMDEPPMPQMGYIAPEVAFEPDRHEAAYLEDEDASPVPLVAVTPVLSGGNNGWFGHRREGLPIWLTAGVPVTAVSIFALGFMLRDMPASGIAPAPDLPAPEAATVLAALPAPIEAIASAEPQFVVSPQVLSARQETGPAGTPAIFTAPAMTQPLAAAYRERVATRPSVKPASLAYTPRSGQIDAITRPQAAPTRRTLPVRMFTGPMAQGSAAGIVNAVAQQSGPVLSKSEQLWLARDMERALENEIDGRSVSLKSRQGQRVRLILESSRQVQRDFSIARVSEIAALPHNMVLEGGWYAARKDLVLHARPALNTGLSHRLIKQDTLLERMATYTDRYGDRWYLMGQRGLAVGFLSAGDVVLAAALNGQFGDPYAAPQGAQTTEIRTVYTLCREGFIGPEGGLVERLQVCRDAGGHWVSHNEGQVSTRQASLSGSLLPKAGTASAIVLAEATGDPVAYHAFAHRAFRRRMQGDLAYARTGQTTEQKLPDGDLIRFTFGELYRREGVIPIVRVEALGELPSRLHVAAGWMKAPIGAKLRAVPDPLAQSSLGEIPAGRAVETMGIVRGIRGDDWVLVGRAGVGFGYVPAAQLVPIEGRVSPYAIANMRQQAIATLVEAVTPCRTVSYETRQSTGQFEACQQGDASWALITEPRPGPQFATRDTELQTAP